MRDVWAIAQYLDFSGRRAGSTEAIIRGVDENTVVVVRNVPTARDMERRLAAAGKQARKVVTIEHFHERMAGVYAPILFDADAVAELCRMVLEEDRRSRRWLMEQHHIEAANRRPPMKPMDGGPGNDGEPV